MTFPDSHARKGGTTVLLYFRVANAKVRTLKEIVYILGNIGHCFSYTVFIYFLIF